MSARESNPPRTSAGSESTEASSQRRSAEAEYAEVRAALNPPTSSIGTVTTGSVSAWKRIGGFPILYFVVFFLIVFVSGALGTLPDTMLSGFAVSMVLGAALMWAGNLVPFIRDYGFPTILCTFGPALLIFFGLVPRNAVTVVQHFLDGYGFLDFFVVAVIVGSVLGMPRKLLLAAGPRFVVPLVGCLVVTFAVIWVLGSLLGFGGLRAVLFIAAPVMAGGLGVGAAPMSQMYAQKTGGSADAYMGDLMSAVVLANIFCIIFAGVYNGLGKSKKQLFVGFNGHGQLLRVKSDRADLTVPPKRDAATYVALGKGFAIVGVLYLFGETVGSLLPFLHPYAWTIIMALIMKIFRIFPKDLEDSATAWSELVSSFLVPALLVSVSMTYISIDEVLESLANPSFIPLTIITVVVAGISSGAIGWLVKMNFVEASVTPGLVLADTGGSGDVAVLSAAGRMHLMPFAALTNRVGGVLVLFVTSLMVTWL